MVSKKSSTTGTQSEENLWAELSLYKSKKKKKHIIKNIVAPIGNFFFVLFNIPFFTYVIFKTGNDVLITIGSSLSERIAFFDIKYISKKYFQLCDQNIYTIILSFVLPFAVSFLLSAILTLILKLSVNPKPAECPNELLNDSESVTRACRSLISVIPDVKYHGYLVFAIPIPALITVLGIFFRKTELNSVLLTLATSAVIYIFLATELWLSSLFVSVLYRFGPSEKNMSSEALHMINSDYVSEIMSRLADNPNADTGKINIYYNSEYDGANDITVSLQVDGNKLGILSNGKNTFELSNGKHSLEAEIFNKKSKKSTIVKADDFEINSDCYEVDLGLKK